MTARHPQQTSPDQPPHDPVTRFYAEVLRFVSATRVPFLIGGAYAINSYTGINRETKDVDLFIKPGDYPRLLNLFAADGYQVSVEDDRWIAKVCKRDVYCDLIFGSANSITPVTDHWFEETFRAEVLGVQVQLLPPAELLWSKAFIADRTRYDGNDIAHLILRQHEKINWKKLIAYMDQHWEVLLVHLLLFRYIYPSERAAIPGWLIDDLLARLAEQRRIPLPQRRVCRGRVLSRDDYVVDVTQWGFADLLGDHWTPGGKPA